jgi:hypothetical protein
VDSSRAWNSTRRPTHGCVGTRVPR